MIASDAYFLSANNSLANKDQRDVEDIALRLIERPELKKTREIATLLWREATAFPAKDQMPHFDGMIDEYIFHFAMRGANSDAWYPKVARFMAPPHHWFGRDVPGSRWAGDSPDFIYRIIPIAHGVRYEIRGRTTCEVPPDATYQLIETRAAPISLGLLDSLDIHSDNGEFVITVDSTPAEGRKNHLQTYPDADHLLIRDALGDWLAQSPNALRVQRLDIPDRGPLSEEILARRAARLASDWLYYTFYCTQSGNGRAPNEMRPPSSSGAYGGMPTQWSCKGTLDLADDEALIVRTNAAGALFRNIVLTDAFHLSLNYWSRTSSLNMKQMAADNDGYFTCVVAHEDPGIHNWLDTCGLHRSLYGQRWQAIPSDYVGDRPTLSARVVMFRDLKKQLPAGVRSIDATTRQQQIAQREVGFARRFVDC